MASGASTRSMRGNRRQSTWERRQSYEGGVCNSGPLVGTLGVAGADVAEVGAGSAQVADRSAQCIAFEPCSLHVV
jgi:hypothetical protein